jgi:YHS domain-containing protein
MNVAADKGYSMAWGGTTYRFCSRSCLEKFEASPEKFAAAGAGKA